MSRLQTLFASFLFSILVSATCVGQDSLMLLKQQLSYYDKYFSRHGISLEEYAFDNPTINVKLRDVLRYDQKAHNKIVGAGLLAGLGIGLMALSTLSKPTDNSLQTQVGNLIGNSFLFTVGLVSGIVAIPLGASSAKYRKERNKALAEVQGYFLYMN